MSKRSLGVCDPCCSTGILRATLVNEEEGGRHIAVVVCGASHYNNDAAEKNMIAMHNATGLGIDIISVEKPGDKQGK